MSALRTLTEIEAAGAAAGAAMPPLSQSQADRVAAILASCRIRLRAPEPQAA